MTAFVGEIMRWHPDGTVTYHELRIEDEPYVVEMPINYRLDGNEPHFRSAIMFASDRSARFDIRIELLFGERVLFRSDTLEVNTFIPRTTMRHVGP